MGSIGIGRGDRTKRSSFQVRGQIGGDDRHRRHPRVQSPQPFKQRLHGLAGTFDFECRAGVVLDDQQRWITDEVKIPESASLVQRHLDRASLRMLQNPLALHWTLLPLVG